MALLRKSAQLGANLSFHSGLLQTLPEWISAPQKEGQTFSLDLFLFKEKLLSSWAGQSLESKALSFLSSTLTFTCC